MNEKPDYARGCWIKEIKFQNGGSKLSINIASATFSEWLKQRANEKGYVKVDIFRLKQPDRDGNTHGVALNTWKPDPNKADERRKMHGSDAHEQSKANAYQPESSNEEMPF